MEAEHIAAYLRSIGEPEMGEEVMQMHSRLEAFADGTDRAAFDGMKQAAEAAIRQRDELLAALVVAEEILETETEYVEFKTARDRIAKAIASVKGGSHHSGGATEMVAGQDDAKDAALQWKPIETAPKGARGYSWIYLTWGNADDLHTGMGLRCGDKFFAAGTFYCAGQEKQYELRELEVNPTHWMPLPPAPSIASASGQEGGAA